MEDDITIKQCAQPKDTIKISLATDHKVQSDTGANANITSDLSILEDIKWVEPVFCKSAKKGASIEVHAIGKYSIRGTPLKINMYYCPDADNTIVSPTAIVRQNISQFIGYQKYLRIDKSVGHIRLIAREGHQDIHIPIYAVNDLCCHHHSHTIADPTKWQDGPGTPTVNRLSDAAKWELWHQRLVHPGTRVMEQHYLCSDGVPQLRRNAFWRCPSCMSGKLMTKLSGKHKNLGSNDTSGDRQQPGKPPLSTPLKEQDEEDDDLEDYLDDIHLPDALLGQHFHIDFGFVQGSEFKVPTEKGKVPH